MCCLRKPRRACRVLEPSSLHSPAVLAVQNALWSARPLESSERRLARLWAVPGPGRALLGPAFLHSILQPQPVSRCGALAELQPLARAAGLNVFCS